MKTNHDHLADEMGSPPNVFYIAVSRLPSDFDVVRSWADTLLRDDSQVTAMRVVIDCSRLPVEEHLPTVKYLTQLGEAVRPLTSAASRTRCAIVVPSQPLIWRARLFESIMSGSRMRFRAFEHHEAAYAWLAEGDESAAHVS